MRKGLKWLGEAGAAVTVVPCNTAHAFVPGLAAELGVNLLSIVEETVTHIITNHPPGSFVSLMATRGTHRASIYHDALESREIHVLPREDDTQQCVDRAIGSVKAGEGLQAVLPRLEQTVAQMVDQGTELVIAGCTEMAIALEKMDGLTVPVLDPARVLARAVVQEVMGRNPSCKEPIL